MRHRHRCLPVNFAKFLTISLLQNTSGRLLLLLLFPCNFTKIGHCQQCFKNLRWIQFICKHQPQKYRSGISFLSRQHEPSVYVLICLHCLLLELATGVKRFIRKGALKNSVNLTENHLCWSLFLLNLEAWYPFWRRSLNDCFCTAIAPLAVTYLFYYSHKKQMVWKHGAS